MDTTETTVDLTTTTADEPPPKPRFIRRDRHLSLWAHGDDVLVVRIAPRPGKDVMDLPAWRRANLPRRGWRVVKGSVAAKPNHHQCDWCGLNYTGVAARMAHPNVATPLSVCRLDALALVGHTLPTTKRQAGRTQWLEDERNRHGEKPIASHFRVEINAYERWSQEGQEYIFRSPDYPDQGVEIFTHFDADNDWCARMNFCDGASDQAVGLRTFIAVCEHAAEFCAHQTQR